MNELRMIKKRKLEWKKKGKIFETKKKKEKFNFLMTSFFPPYITSYVWFCHFSSDFAFLRFLQPYF